MDDTEENYESDPPALADSLQSTPAASAENLAQNIEPAEQQPIKSEEACERPIAASQGSDDDGQVDVKFYMYSFIV